MTQTRRDRELAVLKELRRIFRSTQKHFQGIETRCGVSGAQLWVLHELRQAPGMRVSDLAAAMSIHQSTASNLLDKLEKRGLIRRQRSDADQRVVQLSLTDDGAAVLSRAPRPARDMLPDALHRLPDDALAGLEQHLAALVAVMPSNDDADRSSALKWRQTG